MYFTSEKFHGKAAAAKSSAQKLCLRSALPKQPPALKKPKLRTACAVERRFRLAGANPVQQLTLRLVAARAVHGGNDMG